MAGKKRGRKRAKCKCTSIKTCTEYVRKAYTIKRRGASYRSRQAGLREWPPRIEGAR